ncbi:MAG: hypothetical protein P4L79_16455 [Legionella sp.]|uniref:hypothetical protein n=1 Tax=Legionella sp. TaxID=459 RepID=UPI0028438AFB|nr:hypothetical protein [Legionella sp.]
MKARYEDLTQTTDRARKQQFRTEYAKGNFDLQTVTSNFAVFTHKNWHEPQTSAASKNWKAHISIRQEDLPRAWDLIYDLLSKHAKQFKVVDLNKLQTKSERHLKEHAEAEERHRLFTENYLQRNFATPQLEERAHSLCSAEELGELARKKTTLPPTEYNTELYEKISQKYAQDCARKQLIIAEDRRMAEGMQISIYMLPGKEYKHQELFKQIERVLIENDIRPGNPYQTDRILGQYVSVRHPGSEYQEAVTVENYNPDGEEDPFEELLVNRIQELEALMARDIARLRAFATHDRMTETERHNTTVKNELGDFLYVKLNEFSNKSTQDKIQGIQQFQGEVANAISSADSLLKYDAEWKPFLKNFALLLSGFGTLHAIASFASRIVSGRYLFFDDKESVFTAPKAPVSSVPAAESPPTLALSETENHAGKYRAKVSSMRSEGGTDDEELREDNSKDYKEPLLRSSSINL